MPGNHPGRKYLIEPYIDSFEKFNSNSGAVFRNTQYSQVMQALSHYSYHVTGGQIVLCDLQGGVVWTKKTKGIILTDPVILSRSRSYGLTDLGANGISTFFSRHVCNSYCNRDWQKPKAATAHYPASASTTMELTPSSSSYGYSHQHYHPQPSYQGGGLVTFYEDDEEEYTDSDDYY
jgi:hypothetical protein